MTSIPDALASSTTNLFDTLRDETDTLRRPSADTLLTPTCRVGGNSEELPQPTKVTALQPIQRGGDGREDRPRDAEPSALQAGDLRAHADAVQQIFDEMEEEIATGAGDVSESQSIEDSAAEAAADAGADLAPPPACDDVRSSPGPCGDVEEAREPRRMKDPAQPTRAEWEAHQVNHLPYRSWCRYCVEGRCDNPPHSRRPAGKEPPSVPEVHIDYAFVRRDGEERTTTILVAKHRQSRAVRCWVVPRKGRDEDVATELALEGIRGFGISDKQRVVLKSDNEGPILALRRRVAAIWPGGVLEQSPAPYESESNGVVENGVRMGKGLLRVHLLALEARLQGRISCSSPLFAWLVMHSSAVLTKNLMGKDGRTPYYRLYGKEVSEEGLEFAEKIRWRPPRGENYGVLLEARWCEGLWLGRHWTGSTHYIFDPATKTVKDVRAVQRVPVDERWSIEAAQSVSAWPRLLTPDAERAVEPEARVIPEDRPRDLPPDFGPRHRPHPVPIVKSDLERLGYTDGCAKCLRVRGDLPSRGWKHTAACRERVERALREEDDPRVRAADLRWQERIVEEGGDPSLALPDAGAVAPDDVNVLEDNLEHHRLADGDPAPSAAEPHLPPSDHPDDADAVDAHMDVDGDMEVDDDGDADYHPMIAGLVRSMPADLRLEVDDLLDLYALNGVEDAAAARAIAELYSPPPCYCGTPATACAVPWDGAYPWIHI